MFFNSIRFIHIFLFLCGWLCTSITMHNICVIDFSSGARSSIAHRRFRDRCATCLSFFFFFCNCHHCYENITLRDSDWGAFHLADIICALLLCTSTNCIRLARIHFLFTLLSILSFHFRSVLMGDGRYTCEWCNFWLALCILIDDSVHNYFFFFDQSYRWYVMRLFYFICIGLLFASWIHVWMTM